MPDGAVGVLGRRGELLDLLGGPGLDWPPGAVGRVPLLPGPAACARCGENSPGVVPGEEVQRPVAAGQRVHGVGDQRRRLGVVVPEHHAAGGSGEPLGDVGVVDVAEAGECLREGGGRPLADADDRLGRAVPDPPVGRGQQPAQQLDRQHGDVIGHGGTAREVGGPCPVDESSYRRVAFCLRRAGEPG